MIETRHTITVGEQTINLTHDEATALFSELRELLKEKERVIIKEVERSPRIGDFWPVRPSPYFGQISYKGVSL